MSKKLAEKAIKVLIETSKHMDFETEYCVIMDALAKLLRLEDKEEDILEKNK